MTKQKAKICGCHCGGVSFSRHCKGGFLFRHCDPDLSGEAIPKQGMRLLRLRLAMTKKHRSRFIGRSNLFLLSLFILTFNFTNFITFNSLAQPANPPDPTVNPPVSCGAMKTLTEAAPPDPPGGVTYYWQGTDCNNNSTANNASSPYTVSYNCTNSIYYYVKARDNSTGQWSAGCGSADVGVPRNPVPCKPSDPTTTNYTCGNQTLTRVGTPPADVVFYWQGTDPNGTSTANSASTYTVTATGTYYIRAKDNCSGQWSATSGSMLSTINNTLPDAPPNPTVNPPASCGATKTLTEAAPPDPPGGVTYYWQGTNSAGTDMTYNASSSYTVSYNCTNSIYYYVRTRSDAGCWSTNSGSVDVGVPRNPVPCKPSDPSTTNYTCGNQTLTRVGTPPTDVVFYWQGTDPNGTSTANSASTYTVTATDTYYIRAKDNCSGQWSATSGSMLSTINNTLPDAPPNPAENTPGSCGNKYLTEASPPDPPGGVTYYWQGTNSNGTSTDDPASLPYAVSDNCTWVGYYVRTRSDAGCWSSGSSSISVYNCNPAPPCTPPSNPPTPTISSTCASRILTRAEPPANVSYFWQGTSCGTISNNSDLTYTVTVSGTYYLRAMDITNGTWSAGCASVVANVFADPTCFIHFGGNNDGFSQKAYCYTTLDGFATPLAITPIAGSATVCNNTNETYSTSVSAGVAEHFYWTGPANFTIQRYQGINPVLVTIPTSGNINVNAYNSCQSLTESKAITASVCGINRGGNNDGFASVELQGAGIPLPIELLRFTAVPIANEQVLTQWTTLSEINNDYFTVEQSIDTVHFKETGKIKGAGYSNTTLRYEFIDSTPFRYGGSKDIPLYYRLKQTDYDGNYTYSNMVAVTFKEENIITVYPNPSDGNFEITCQMYDVRCQRSNVIIYNMLGEKVYQQTLNTKQETLNTKLPKGLYFLQVVTDEGVWSERIMIIKEFKNEK